MEKEICQPLINFRNHKTLQLTLNKEHRRDFDEIISTSQEIVQEIQDDYSKIYNDKGVTIDYHAAHNEYLLELTGMNSLYSKYQYNILPQLLQVKIFFLN
jgi:hypothetical protein